MSWKSLVTAGLLCALASPAFAVPALEIVNGGLNAQGNWVWNVRIAGTVGEALATELGFKATGGNVVSVTNTGSGVFDTNTAGNAPASMSGWIVNYGTPAKPEGLQGNFAGAAAGTTVVNAAALGGTTPATGVNGVLNEIFAALGSKVLAVGDLSTPAGSGIGPSAPYLTIITAGPTDTSATASIQLLGAYDGANNSGRIAEGTGATTSANYKNFTGTATRTVVPGDANLSDGVAGTTPAVTGADLAILAANLGGSGTKTWSEGDFNGSTGGVGEVSGADLAILADKLGDLVAGTTSNLARTGTLDSPGSGLGSGGAVPEPASVALLGLAGVGLLGLVRRKR